jgi:hypothetical protein
MTHINMVQVELNEINSNTNMFKYLNNIILIAKLYIYK